MHKWLTLLLVILLSACAGDDAVRLGPQEWGGVSFIVESRPSPIRQGMNEFIVIATRDRVKPGVGFVVSLRSSDSDEWRQAIQDGYTGVYRRAVMVRDPQGGVLQVHVRRVKGMEETVLRFPLATKHGES